MDGLDGVFMNLVLVYLDERMNCSVNEFVGKVAVGMGELRYGGRRGGDVAM